MSTAPKLTIREDKATAKAPLTGVRVVDFTRVLAGPFGTQILGDLGAEVIKIENPMGGDDTRMLRPDPKLGGETSFFMSLNRSKRSVAIDLKNEAGRAVALDLIGKADVLVENFAGSVMRRFALDYPSLKDKFPSLIYCSVSGYGRTGPNADAAGYDTPLGAEAGVLSINAQDGGDAVNGAIPYTDVSTALNATIGILAALHARSQTGLGQHVDVAMFDAALANLSFIGADFLTTGNPTQLYPRQSAGPNGLFETADGEVVITCGKDKMFQAFCLEVMDRPDWLEDARFKTIPVRLQNGKAFLEELNPLLKTHTSAYWSERCKRAGIPCGELRTPGQALLSPEAQERGLVFGLPHPTAGVAPAIAQPVRFSETPCRYGTPPILGQHTAEVLQGLLGYSDAKLSDLEASGAIALAKAQQPTNN